jgi:hypothetical protein
MIELLLLRPARLTLRRCLRLVSMPPRLAPGANDKHLRLVGRRSTLGGGTGELLAGATVH